MSEIDYTEIPDDLLADYMNAYEAEEEAIQARMAAGRKRAGAQLAIAANRKVGFGGVIGLFIREEAQRRGR